MPNILKILKILGKHGENTVLVYVQLKKVDTHFYNQKSRDIY